MPVKDIYHKLRSGGPIEEKDLIQLQEGIHKMGMQSTEPLVIKQLARLILNEVFGHQHKIFGKEVKLDVRKRTIQTDA